MIFLYKVFILESTLYYLYIIFILIIIIFFVELNLFRNDGLYLINHFKVIIYSYRLIEMFVKLN